MGAFVYINLSTMISCLVFLIFLYFIYFSKKNMSNIENKIYRQLLLWTGLVLLSSLIYQILVLITTDVSIFKIVTKIYYGTLDSWVFMLMFYILVVSNEKREKLYAFFNKKICFIYVYITIFFINLIDNVLPITDLISKNGEFIYVAGPSCFAYYIFIAVPVLVAIMTTLINRKTANRKKLLPFFIMVPLGLLAVITMIIVPQYAVIQLFFTVAVYLMFFTIENPDIKVISELEFARDQAEKANNAKSDFLASMSHELRTPLNAIVGLSQMIEVNDNVEEMHNDSRDIIVASQKLLELVDGILEVNKLDTNDISVVERNYNFNDVISDLEENIKLRIGDKPIQFKMKVSEDIPNVLCGDKDKIKIIINNLLSNAVKYTDEGSVELSIDCLNAKERCNLRINVSDTGRGIKEEDIENIYTKFYRSEENKDSDISGTGLGLSITKSLVELMDGKINVNSNEGVGTTFLVTISQKIVENNTINNQETEIL